MARRMVVTLEDDLDGGPAAETLRFTLEGQEYEIDLSAANAARFRRDLAPFAARARRSRAEPRQAMRTAASRRRSRDIRAWAMEQGMEVSRRGRIPASVVDRYQASASLSRR